MAKDTGSASYLPLGIDMVPKLIKLQLKSTFEANNVAFPILVPRTFACFLPSYSVEKLEKNLLFNLKTQV